MAGGEGGVGCAFEATPDLPCCKTVYFFRLGSVVVRPPAHVTAGGRERGWLL